MLMIFVSIKVNVLFNFYWIVSVVDAAEALAVGPDFSIGPQLQAGVHWL